MVDVSQSSELEPVRPKGRTRQLIDGVLGGMYALRVSIVLGALTIAALTIPDQVRELHRVLAQERAEDGFFTWYWLLSLGSLFALSLVLWQTARHHAEDYLDSLGGEGTADGPLWKVLAWGPRFIATMPFIGAAVGTWASQATLAGLDKVKPQDIPTSLTDVLGRQYALSIEFKIGAATFLGLALAVLILTTWFERSLAPVGSRRVRRLARVNVWLLFPVLILASIGLLTYSPVEFPQALGSIPIFALWVANLSVLVALLGRYSRAVGFPLVVALLLMLIVFESTGATDNHAFRIIDKNREIARPSVEDTFRTWIASRGDLEAYRAANKPYPVYVVATEGGGLYAAYQTAKLLGRMQDLCENFAQHVFAISAVSGGSLGSAVFTGLTKDYAQNGPAKPCLPSLQGRGRFEAAAQRALSRDLLSPVVWATLFPDFLQRFVPYPFSKLDRGYSLELAFEQTWRRRGGDPAKNYIAAPFFESCGANPTDCAKTATPQLALNVTNVETGMQMVLSQMELISWPQDGPPKPFDVFSNGTEPVDLSVSTAVGLSARFPWISPQGWYTFADPAELVEFGPEKAKRRRMSFVDGGYVDNSGVSTATKIARVLWYWSKTDPTLPPLDIKLIVISAAWIPFDRFWIESPQNASMSEYVSPLVAALAAWQGRGFTAQTEAKQDRLFEVIDMGVYYNFMPLPVGWHLSNLSRRYIDEFKGHPDKCDQTKAAMSNLNHAAMANSYINQANCSAARVIKDLSPSAP